MSKSYTVAVVGATGAVGRQMLAILEGRSFPVGRLLALASARSAGQQLPFAGGWVTVEELRPESFAGVDLALFSAGAGVSRRFAPLAAAAGALVVDNSSAFRMEPDVPLVVPEVNPQAAGECPRRIIANPNCSTIQLVVALEPLRREAGLRRVVVTTYQAVSGAGRRAIDELGSQARAWAAGEPAPKPEAFPHPILFDCLPQIGAFAESGFTLEEEKMIFEPRKIFRLPELAMSPTCVRVPVITGHSEAVHLSTERPLSVERARELLAGAPGVTLWDAPEHARYPLARAAAETDPVYVGRLRADPGVENGLAMWVVADNLRKGAALNAIQIAELPEVREPLGRR